MTEHEQRPEAFAAEEECQPRGFWSRIFGIILSPGETFADINRHPSWALILMATVLISSASLFLLQVRVPNLEERYGELIRQRIEQELERRGAARPPEEALARQIEVQKRIFRFFPLFPIPVVPLVMLILSAIFFLGLLLLQADTTFKKTFSVVSWSYGVTSSVGGLLSILVLFLRDPSLIDPTATEGWVATNLAAMLGLSAQKTHPALFAVASSLDIFTIWFLILAALGFSAISRKLSRAKAFVFVLVLWVLWIGGKTAWYTFTAGR